MGQCPASHMFDSQRVACDDHRRIRRDRGAIKQKMEENGGTDATNKCAYNIVQQGVEYDAMCVCDGGNRCKYMLVLCILSRGWFPAS